MDAVAADDEAVVLAGRVLRIRDYGGVLFAQLRDWSGEVQLLLDNSHLERGSTADFTAGMRTAQLANTKPSKAKNVVMAARTRLVSLRATAGSDILYSSCTK